ncbi:hypothetical protein ACTHGU_11860 [Chitinophagaceae bacterium MMS25-I14]
MSAQPGRLNKTGQHFTAILLLCGLVYFLFPYYRYFVDPDATSYLTIITRYANGDYAKAVNGFWSPLSCWLAALAVKYLGMSPFPAAVLVNTMAAAKALYFSQRIFQKFYHERFGQWCFGLVLAVFWAHTVYYQLCCDVWQAAFLLGILLLFIRKDFTAKPVLWLVTGIATAVAYFAKTYSFYAVPLMLAVTLGCYYFRKEVSLQKSLTIFISVLLVQIAACMPWLVLLHDKYGDWSIGYAGKLNMSWWVAGAQKFRSDIHLLIPPLYPDSTCYFEDPWYAQGVYDHFWDSPAMLARQLIRVAYNLLRWVETANFISPFYFITWLLSILLMLRTATRTLFSRSQQIMILCFLVYPAGFWLLLFDARYIWFTVPLSMAIGLLLTQRFLFNYFNETVKRLFILVFMLSYLPGAISDLKANFRSGEKEYAIAQQLTQLHIQGPFISNITYGPESPSLLQLSYFAHCPVYFTAGSGGMEQALLQDAQRYPVKYFFYRYNGPEDNYVLHDLQGKELPELTHSSIPGLKVFALKQ